jgi:hypothetical protein
MPTRGDHDAAFVRLAGNQGGTGVAALRDAAARIEEESTFPFSRAHGMAFEALIGEEGTDVRLKKGEVVFRGGRG